MHTRACMCVILWGQWIQSYQHRLECKSKMYVAMRVIGTIVIVLLYKLQKYDVYSQLFFMKKIMINFTKTHLAHWREHNNFTQIKNKCWNSDITNISCRNNVLRYIKNTWKITFMSKENVLFNVAVTCYDHIALVLDEYECIALVK